MEKPINIFVSYSHKDAIWINEEESGNNTPYSFSLIPWLAACLRKDDVNVWHDHALKQLPGEEYKKKIKTEIDNAHIAILLISQDFANSDFIYQYELPWIRERVESNALIVIPILVGPTDFGSETHLKWVNERQILPGKPTPLIRYINNPADFQEVRLEILLAVRNRIRQLRDKESGFDIIDEPKPGYPTKGDLIAVQDSAEQYASLIRKNPMLAAFQKEALKGFAQRLQENNIFENKLPRAVSIVYRLYSAAIFLTQSNDLIDQTQQGMPWLKKSLELNAGFKDIKELQNVNNFFVELLTGQIKNIDLEIFVRHNIRVAMIEATEEEVTTAAQQIVKEVIKIKGKKE
jgi:hypothetical protein